ASILLAPVVFLALLGGVLKIALTALWPGLAGIWASIAQAPISWMRRSVDWLAGLPHGDVPFPAPPAWVVVLFYVTLLLAAVNWRRPGARNLTKLAFAGAMAVLLLLPFGSTITQAPRRDGLRITILYVGAGQCAVIEPPSGRTTLIDAGSLSLSDPVRRAIAPFLRFRGITELDTIAISHGNSDHFSAVAELVEAYGAREVLVAQGFSGTVRGNQQASEMMTSLARSERPPRTVSFGEIVPLGSNTSIEVLWPPPALGATELSPNDQSMVLRFTHAGVRVLFTGDIQEAAMTELLKTPDLIRADILIAPHHGSSELSTPAFIAAVQPRAIISSNDRTLTGKQKRFEAMAGLLPVFRTHTSGAVTIRIDSQGHYRVDPFIRSLPAVVGHANPAP
ncbi:MAG: ComEC/Rec2 family competence protein, partial [Burkholderiales bacterium]|nr:ComEC/Rec2 family competence protein [Phycisphaerae bacterium]